MFAVYLLSDLDGPPTAFPAERAPVHCGCPCRGPLGCPPMPRQDGIGDKAPTLICCTAEACIDTWYQAHPFGQAHVSWVLADLDSTYHSLCHLHAVHDFLMYSGVASNDDDNLQLYKLVFFIFIAQIGPVLRCGSQLPSTELLGHDRHGFVDVGQERR